MNTCMRALSSGRHRNYRRIITICSSHGEVYVDPTDGSIVLVDITCSCAKNGKERCTLKDMAPGSGTFDIAKYIAMYGQFRDCIDILDIGYTDQNGIHEPPRTIEEKEEAWI